MPPVFTPGVELLVVWAGPKAKFAYYHTPPSHLGLPEPTLQLVQHALSS